RGTRRTPILAGPAHAGRALTAVNVALATAAHHGAIPHQKGPHMSRNTLSLLALAVAGVLAAPGALAQPAGDWTVAVGAHQVNPDSDNGALAGGALPLDIGSSVRPTIAFEYFLRDNLGLEVLAALPFRHDIDIDGLGQVGSTKHLPPTISLQYHFNSAGKVSPLLGVGLNYTTFFSEDTRGALAGSDLELD